MEYTQLKKLNIVNYCKFNRQVNLARMDESSSSTVIGITLRRIILLK